MQMYPSPFAWWIQNVLFWCILLHLEVHFVIHFSLWRFNHFQCEKKIKIKNWFKLHCSQHQHILAWNKYCRTRSNYRSVNIVPSNPYDKITSAPAAPNISCVSQKSETRAPPWLASTHSGILRKRFQLTGNKQSWDERQKRRRDAERSGMPTCLLLVRPRPLLLSCAVTGCPLVAMTSEFTWGSVFAERWEELTYILLQSLTGLGANVK